MGPLSIRVAPEFRDRLVDFIADLGHDAAPTGEDSVSVDFALVRDEDEVRSELEGELERFGREHPGASPRVLA